MIQIRGKGPVFMAIFILCLLVVMPFFFAEIKEKTLLNQVVIEKIPENVLVDHTSEDLTVSEKLELIVRGRNGDSGVVTVSGGISGIENDQIIGERACREVEKLLSKDVILPFDVSDVFFEGGSPMNYVDLNDMSQSVSLMWVHLSFSSVDMDVTMDVDTSQIYEYNLYWNSYSMTDDMDMAGLDQMIENFRDYTGLSQEEFEYFYDCSGMPEYIALYPM